MAKRDSTFEVAIVGAGPAGSTAAALLAQMGHTVALVDAAKFPRPVPCAGWVSAHAAPLLKTLGLSWDKLDARAIREVTFHNADFSKIARPVFEEAPGYLVDRGELDRRLADAATRAGAKFLSKCRVDDLTLAESSVTLHSQGGDTTARLLILAAGRATPLFDRLGLGSATTLPTGCLAAQVDAKSKDIKRDASVAVIFGVDGAGGIGFVAAAPKRVSIGVHTHIDQPKIRPLLARLCSQAVQNGIIAEDFSSQAARAEIVPSPASVALAMETHVAKHTLIIGDAGGFVTAVSGEGIYPAMWSAAVAADCVHEALAAASPQDVLIGFDTKWRTAMADHIRPPNTDTHYLLPLIFSNQPMADRMGAAFFCGENI